MPLAPRKETVSGAFNRPTGEGREALENRPLLLLRRMARAQDRPRASSKTVKRAKPPL